MTENKWTNARISMILFCAKEQLDMWNDVVEKRV